MAPVDETSGMHNVIDREFVAQSFTTRENTRMFDNFEIRKNILSERGCGFALRCLFGLLIMTVACLRNATATTAGVVFEHWPHDLTQMNNRLALFSVICCTVKLMQISVKFIT